jgi:ferrous iron transport protein B
MDTKKNNNSELLEVTNKLRWEVGDDFHDSLVESIFTEAAAIAAKAVSKEDEKQKFNFDAKLDKIVTSKLFGLPIMLALLAIVFWLTIVGANIPSEFLSTILVGKVYPFLKSIALGVGLPTWLTGILIDGGYMAAAWVASVMLPPMAIFFPVFTLLEDFGYLPRVAFNMDNIYRKVGAHGKQALTMSMGFGCNVAGVVASRIIDSRRERLIAIITNNFSLCNGRWPTQILIATIFIGNAVPANLAGIVAAGAVVTVALLGIGFSLITSWGLSKSVLKGESSSFSLELPPYRPPRILQTLYTSLIDRTLIVLWRAVVFALPAGMVIWLVSNLQIGGLSLAEHLIHFLNPFGLLIGLNGIILLAYIIAIPANEIVIPTVLMLTVLTLKMTAVGAGAGVLFDTGSEFATLQIFHAGGWTLLTGINLMLFSLLHNPCSTTIYTIYKETKSAKWTAISTFLPLIMGFIVCFLLTQFWRLFTGV